MDNTKDYRLDDGKTDDHTTGDSTRKVSPRASPGHLNADLTNGTINETHPSTDVIGTHDDTHDTGIPSSMLNGLPTASMPIPAVYPRMQNNTHSQQQQQQQQQQQMLLFQQQQQQA